MSDDTHAKYSPSQLPRIIGCPGSITVHKQTASSKYAEEGTKCHDIVAHHLERGEYQLEVPRLDVFDLENRAELGEAIQDCLDFTFSLVSQYDNPAVLVEHYVSVGGFAEHFNCVYLDEVAGTGDLIIMVPSERIIHIVDWKFGKGIEVFPESDQLKAYGLAALKTPFLAAKYDKAFLHIGQPRLYSGEKFKVHETTPTELLSWASDELVPALVEANSATPEFCPSENACRWCYARATCLARFDMAQKTAEDVFRIHAELPKVKNVEELAEFLDRARNLSAYISDIEKFITNTLRAGFDVPGLKMVEGRSIRQWVDEKAFVQWAYANYPDEEIFENKVLSPSKAEKLFKRKIASTDAFQALIHKPPGKHTLVTDKDPRTPIKYEDASEVFADFTEEED